MEAVCYIHLVKLEVVLPRQLLHLDGRQQLDGAGHQRHLDGLLRLTWLLQCLLNLLSMVGMLLWLSLLCMLRGLLLSLLHIISLLSMLG